MPAACSNITSPLPENANTFINTQMRPIRMHERREAQLDALADLYHLGRLALAPQLAKAQVNAYMNAQQAAVAHPGLYHQPGLNALARQLVDGYPIRDSTREGG